MISDTGDSSPTVNPILFLIVEVGLIGFFVFGYILYRRRRAGRPTDEG